MSTSEPTPARRRWGALDGVLSRFLVVGVVNTLFSALVLWVLHPHLGLYSATFTAATAGMVLSFVLNGRWTFSVRALDWAHVLRFLAVNALSMWAVYPAGVALAISGLRDTVGDFTGLPAVASLIGTAGSLVVNFVGYRWFVFPTRADLPSRPTQPEATPGTSPGTSPDGPGDPDRNMF